MKKIYLPFLFVFSFGFSQVGINTTTPDQSAMLHIFSNDKGVLLPRLTSIERDSISNPANGLLIFNTTNNNFEMNLGTNTNPKWNSVSASSISLTNNTTPNGQNIGQLIYNTNNLVLSGEGLYVWNGTEWKIIDSSKSWATSGNNALATDFLGTINNVPLVLKSNNTNCAYFNNTNRQLFIGEGVGNSMIASPSSSNSYNYFIGSFICNTMSSGNYNIGLGYSLLTNAANNSKHNIAIGSESVTNSGSAGYNIGIGFGCLKLSGTGNIAIGEGSLRNAGTGTYNVAVGVIAGGSLTNGSFNTLVGRNAGMNVSGNLSTGSYNTLIGHNAGGVTTGSNNISIGYNAVVSNSSSSNQIRIGDTNIALATTQVAWSVSSDKKWKERIENCPLGLNFIDKLRPVSYYRVNNEIKKKEFGLIAQELEKTLEEFDQKDHAIISKDDTGNLSVRYNDLLAPIIKSIQELSEQNTTLNKRILELEVAISKLKNK